LTVSVVLADANILFSRTLRDYVIYAADEGAIEIHWSRQILAEMSRNLREKLGLSHENTSRLEQLMNGYIEYALLDVDPGHLAAVEAVEMDAKDRHVLAAVISADADILLTDNTKDFPAEWMAEQGIELLTAGQLLIRLADAFPDKMRSAHEKTVRYSPKPEADILVTLEAIAGKPAADAIRKVVAHSAPQETPLSEDNG
jgi:predicted nucleic acid-binding protein